MSRHQIGRRAINQRGRNRHDRFVKLPHYVLNSDAYKSMPPGPRALLVEIIKRYNGGNNGEIGLGQREAALACAVKKPDTAAKWFRELEKKGFIRPQRKGGFNMKDPSARRATEWRITWLPTETVRPTNEFRDWNE